MQPSSCLKKSVDSVSEAIPNIWLRSGWNDDDSILFFNCESLNKEFGSAYSALNSGSIAQKHKKNPLQPAPLLELRGGIFTTPVNIPLSVSAPRRGRQQAVFLEIIPHFGCKNMQNWGIGVLEKGTRYAILSTLGIKIEKFFKCRPDRW